MNPTKYLSEVNSEMQKVSWPKRHELISNTVITLVFALLLSLFIYLADQVISTILEFIYS